MRLGEVLEDDRVNTKSLGRDCGCVTVYTGLLLSMKIPTYFTAVVRMASFDMYVNAYVDILDEALMLPSSCKV